LKKFINEKMRGTYNTIKEKTIYAHTHIFVRRDQLEEENEVEKRFRRP